jgi:hypothetical protein
VNAITETAALKDNGNRGKDDYLLHEGKDLKQYEGQNLTVVLLHCVFQSIVTADSLG